MDAVSDSARRWRTHATFATIAGLTVWYLLGIAFEGPGLRGPRASWPFGWQWRYRADRRLLDAGFPLAVAAVVSVVLGLGLPRLLRARRPGLAMALLLLGSVLFRVALFVATFPPLRAGPPSPRYPHPKHYLLDAASSLSTTDLLASRHRPEVHRRLRLHSRNKPPGLILLARGMLYTTRRGPALRRGLLALYGSVPRWLGLQTSSEEGPDRAMAAAAILWSYAMTACALVAALPLRALARDLVGERGAWWATGFWLFSPTVMLFSPVPDQAVAMLALLALWLLHSAYETGSVVRAGLSAVVLWLSIMVSFSGLTAFLLAGVYIGLRIAFDLSALRADPPGCLPRLVRTSALLAPTLGLLVALAASTRTAASFEQGIRVARYALGCQDYEPTWPSVASVTQSILVWSPSSMRNLHQMLMGGLGLVFHLAILCATASALLRGAVQTDPPNPAFRAQRFALKAGVTFVGVFVLGWLAIRFGLGLRLGHVFDMAIMHGQAATIPYRRYRLWFGWNPLCFMVFAGLPVTLLWAWGTLSRGRHCASGAAALGALGIVLMSTNVSGVTRGEAERNWTLLLPLVFVVAGAKAASLSAHHRWLTVLVSLFTIQVVLFSALLWV